VDRRCYPRLWEVLARRNKYLGGALDAG
jgi:hypothetical protein